MSRLGDTLFGYAVICVTAADPERCLTGIAFSGVAFRNAGKESACCVRITVRHRDKDAAVCAVRRAQGDAEICAELPSFSEVRRLLQRPILLLGLLAAAMAMMLLPRYIWFVTVEGNETVAEEEILREAWRLGVRFGIRNSSIDSEQLKNMLLQEIGSLQWAAVNCSGGLCEIRVKERLPVPRIPDHKAVTELVAARSGLICEMRVLEGMGVCAVGDSVLEGDLLVSGILEPSVRLNTAHAQAEIFAWTLREGTAVIPADYAKTTEETERHVSRFIQIGRIRINLSGNSRICTAGCDKMIVRKTISLPGGYTLPVSFITETCIHRRTVPDRIEREEAAELLASFLSADTEAQMIAGEILSSREQTVSANGVFRYSGSYVCREMIAREREVNLFGSEQSYGGENSERRTN